MNDNNQKKLPDSTNYIKPIVEALRSLKGVAKAAAVKQWIADSMASQNQLIPDTILTSGAQKFSNDIQWARMFLVNAEMLEPMAVACRRRLNIEPPCRLKFEPGRVADLGMGNCG